MLEIVMLMVLGAVLLCCAVLLGRSSAAQTNAEALADEVSELHVVVADALSRLPKTRSKRAVKAADVAAQ